MTNVAQKELTGAQAMQTPIEKREQTARNGLARFAAAERREME